MTVPTVVSFSIHAGEALPREPYLHAWESRQGLGTLYGMVEVVAGPPREVAAVVWEGVEEALREPRLTVTRYLQRALEGAHQHLQQYTSRGWRAGATLLALRRDEFYLGGAGPSLAYLLAGGRLVRPGSASQEMRGAGTALGSGGEPVVHVAREAVREGDVLLIAWAGLERAVSETALAALLGTGVENTSQSLYRLVSGEPDFAILAVGFVAAAP